MSRRLPQAVEAEASILGGILLRNEVLGHLEMLEVDDFYDPKHRIVFESVRNLEAGSKPIDAVTLQAEIEKRGKLDAIGGPAFLSELQLLVPTPDNVYAYAEIVQERHPARKLMAAAGD